MPLNLTIYIDVLFLLNLITDYIILSACGFILCRKSQRFRLALASAIGALYSVMIFFPQLTLLNLAFAKTVAGIIILLTAFGFSNIHAFLKLLLTYCVVNSVYGGGMYLFFRFTSLGSKMNCSNGIYYIDLPLWCVLLLVFVFYYLTKVFTKISDQRIPKAHIEQLVIHFLGTRVTVNALYDTGNALYDPLSLNPVIPVEGDIFHGKLCSQLTDKAVVTESLPLLHEMYPKLGLRIVPFKDVAGNKSYMYAFKPEKVVLGSNGKEAAGVLVGIVNSHLSADGRYNALLHSKF